MLQGCENSFARRHVAFTSFDIDARWQGEPRLRQQTQLYIIQVALFTQEVDDHAHADDFGCLSGNGHFPYEELPLVG